MVFFRKTLILVLLAFLVGGCVFKPHEEFVNPIEPPAPLSVVVEINQEGFVEPFPLIRTTEFKFTVKEPKRAIIKYAVFLDGIEIRSYQNENVVSFFLDPNVMESREHGIKIKLWFPTQSGSIAERLGLESYLAEKQFKVIVDKTPPETVNPTVAYENGWPVVRWKGTNKKNFFYRIQVNGFSNFFPGYVRDTVINDPTTTSFIDKSFVRGKSIYSIIAEASSFSTKIGEVSFEDETLTFQTELSEELIARLECRVDRVNLSGLEMRVQDLQSHEVKVFAAQRLFQWSDTFLIGDKRSYTVSLGRQRIPSTFTGFVQKTVEHKPATSQFWEAFFLPGTESVAVRAVNKIVRYRLPNFIPVDSINSEASNAFNGLGFSPRGTKAITTLGPAKLLVFDPSNFQSHEVIDVPHLFPSAIWIGIAQLTDNDLVTVAYQTELATIHAILNLNTKQVIWSNVAAGGMRISDDGRHFAIFSFLDRVTFVYRIIPSGLVLLGTTALGTPEFLPDGNLAIMPGPELAKVLFYEIPDITSASGQPLRLVKQFDVPRTYSSSKLSWIDFDPLSKNFSVFYSDADGVNVKYYDMVLRRFDDFSIIGSWKSKCCPGFSYKYLFLTSGHFQKVL